MQQNLIEVRGLTVKYLSGSSPSPAVRDVNFSLLKGQALALVGESGCGKTTLCRALTRLFPSRAAVDIAGSVQFDSRDILACSDSELADLRQNAIRYVFQEPYAALNPVSTIGKQMLLACGRRETTKAEITQVLAEVGLERPEDVLSRYPHELSVGMAQRVMIAMALLPQPGLLIADEPTSAVDASLRKQLLKLLRSIQTKQRMTMILVTHDLAFARHFADEVAVMHDGALIENASVEEFFRTPQHPYSQLLLKALNDRVSRSNTHLTAHA